ncbi:iron-sulfur cluster insertion protein ErpA [Roseospirillum parvum]|uniref:Iron-sulfur cluster insertion protein n=1 Tax=Roseospirillum parvum TaxID=83401 RepID=A0A1G7YIU6_9PROT|nr:iron-sulfur cluster insertion protein ErpA [Roseospirillum parvum]SDG96403.1 iron-sulfur cluster insertion protein [Roseospirillum parvum]
MSQTAPPNTATPNLGLSQAAARRLTEILAAEGNPGQMLRITVSGGGCSGFKYAFELSAEVGPDDKVFEHHGVKVVTDSASLDILDGSEIDYSNDLMAAAFTVRNPNATATCGCGTSFAV